MRSTLGLCALCLLMSLAATAQGFQDALLDRFEGTWVLRGTIAGGEVVHDITAEWVVGHQYLRFLEVSREREAGGELAYEAIVFLGWDEALGQYACLWLDSTGGSGLSGQAVMGHAKPSDDTLAFLFVGTDGSVFHTTFAYDQSTDSWEWRMDAEADGKLEPFTRATMTRR